jgi:hypothetical protein
MCSLMDTMHACDYYHISIGQEKKKHTSKHLLYP